jgi:hypothetical protein
VVVLATLLGIFLAFAITVFIVRPLLRMAGLLDQLAAEGPAERAPFFPGGRNEVNAMANHKAPFIDWQRVNIREADACERLQQLVNSPDASVELPEAQVELRQLVAARKNLVPAQYQNAHQLIDRILDITETLLEDPRPGANEVALNTIRYSARSVRTLLLMASAREIWKRGGH